MTEPEEFNIEIEKESEIGLNAFLNKTLKNEKLNPPFLIDGDIVTDFTKRCEIYMEDIEKFHKENKHLISSDFSTLLIRVKEIRDCVIGSLEHFLSGDIKSAYDYFDNIMSDEKTIKMLNKITVPLTEICHKDKPLFRVRSSDIPLTERNNIFHIPFSKRHLVNAQRYSVAGLPCLYLGTSLYVCWQEMNKPDFDRLYISSFTASPSVSKILNFASPFLTLPIHTSASEEELIKANRTKSAYLIFWPLIIACSYLKKNTHSTFNQEYIISNLLMQWIGRRSKSPIAGLAYFSTKMPKLRNSHLSINVVLPPKATYKQTLTHDYCTRLTSIFKITPPMSWQVLKTIDYNSSLDDTQEINAARMFLKLKEQFSGINDFEEDIAKLYSLTDFHKLELLIDKLFEHKSIIE